MRKVLVLEDEENIRSFVVINLKRAGYTTIEAGCGMEDVVKTLVFLSDMNDFAAFNGIYAKYFNGPVLPARSCVQVAALPKGALVETECIAVR